MALCVHQPSGDCARSKREELRYRLAAGESAACGSDNFDIISVYLQIII